MIPNSTASNGTADLAHRVSALQTAFDQQSRLLQRLLERVDASSPGLSTRQRRTRMNGAVTVWDAGDDESEGSTGIEQMGPAKKGKGKVAGVNGVL